MTFGRQLLASIAQLLTVVLVARNLGPEGNGFYAMAILVPTMLTNFLNLGIGPATVYYIGRGEFSARQAVKENLRLALIAATIGTTISAIILSLFGAELFPDVPETLLFLGLAALPASLLLAYLNTILQGLEDFKAFNATVLIPPFITLAGVIIALYVLDAGAVGAVTAYLTGQVTGVAIVAVFLNKDLTGVNTEPQPVSSRSYHVRTISYGWKAHLSNILAFVNYRADIFLVNFFLSPAATGLYVIAVQIAEKLWILSKAASIVLLPRLSSMHTNPKARLELTRKGFWAVSLVTGLGSGLAAVAVFWLISPIFGDDYTDAIPAFLWLLPGIIAGAGARVLSNCIAAAGKPQWNMQVAVGVVALNVTGNLILIPAYGLIGAACATSLAYIANAIIKQFLIRKTL